MATDSDPLIDWERRADGEVHELRKGEHFTRDVDLVRKSAGMWAFRHGFRCLTDLDPSGDALSVRFTPRTEKV